MIDGDLEWVERQVAELGGSAALDAFAAEERPTAAAGSTRRRRGGVVSTSGASLARSNSAASLVCGMLSAWGIDRADAPKTDGEPREPDAAAARYAAAKNSGFYGTSSAAAGVSVGVAPGSCVRRHPHRRSAGGGSKRSSMDMMRGAPPSKRTDSLERLGSGSSGASGIPGRVRKRARGPPRGRDPGRVWAGAFGSPRRPRRPSPRWRSRAETPPDFRALRRSSAPVLVDSHRRRRESATVAAGGFARG